MLISLIMLSFSACVSHKKVSKSGGREKAFVAKFLDVMISAEQDSLLAFMSPMYLKENNFEEGVFVNIYGLKHYEVEDYNRDSGIVTVIIWRDTKNEWVHRLKFKVVYEEKQLYLWPSPNNEYPTLYIDPWYDVEPNINRKD